MNDLTVTNDKIKIIKTVLLSLMLAIITVLLISFVDVDCSKAVFYLIKPWIVLSPSQDLVTHKITFIANLLLNIVVVGVIYFLLVFKIKNIKKRYLIALLPITMLVLFYFAFFSHWHGNYAMLDNNNALSLQTQADRNEPLIKGKLSLFFDYPKFEWEQCQPFH